MTTSQMIPLSAEGWTLNQTLVAHENKLPRLLYIGDVPIEASYHGSLLLFRLLENYSAERLTIVETASPSQASRRIPDLNYRSVPLAQSRWLNTRFHPYVGAWYSFKNAQTQTRVSAAIKGGEVDSILTVAHGFGWLAAASIARRAQVPLHLVIHDDWPRVVDLPGSFRNWMDENFARVFRQAASRMCVSPAMATRYLELYGCDATVIYPSRAKNCSTFKEPPLRLAQTDKPFTVAFAGTINSEGYTRLLVELREALATVKGRLLIFGPMIKETASRCGLDDPSVVLCGLLPSDEVIKRLRAEANALFVPMSFNSEDRWNMEMAFPSKLADYTATGLPLLIYGPPYCSAVRWARENPGAAEVVDAENDDSLRLAIQRLANDPAYRVSLGTNALNIGQRYFAYGIAQRTFLDALKS